MSHVLTVAAREVRERSFVFVAAALAALIPFAAALLPYAQTSGRGNVITLAAVILSVGITLGMSVVMGGSMLTRELAERRLSFYFAKPIPASAIWFGKLLGALATVALCFTIVFLPSFVAAHGAWSSQIGGAPHNFVLVVAIAAICFLLVAHAVSTVVRSRSPLVIVDLVFIVASVALLWLIVRPLWIEFAVNLLSYIVWSIGATVIVVLIAAGAWQVSRGRTDIRRSHREMSRFFWIAIAAIMAMTALYVVWILSAGPADLINRYAYANGRGDWMAVAGNARNRADYTPSFLVNTKSGKTIRLSGGRWAGVAFTPGGNAAFLLTPLRTAARGELRVYRFDAPDQSPVTDIQAAMWSAVVVSDDLRRAAVIENGLLSVYDLSSNALLGSVRIALGPTTQMFFVSNDVVRIYTRSSRGGVAAVPEPQQLEIYEFNVAKRQLQQTGSFNATARTLGVRASADGSALVVNRVGAEDGARVLMLDGRTAAVRGSIDTPAPRWVTPLSDGGVAFAAVANGVATLRVFDAAGRNVRDVALGKAVGAAIVQELPGRKLAVTLNRGIVAANNGRSSDVCVIDVNRGAVERVEREFAIRSQQFFGDDPRTAASRTGDFVIVDPMNALWRWNALTGAKAKIL